MPDPGQRRQRAARLAHARIGRRVSNVLQALARMRQGADEHAHPAAGMPPRSHDLTARAGQDRVDLAVDNDVPSHAHAQICSRCLDGSRDAHALRPRDLQKWRSGPPRGRRP